MNAPDSVARSAGPDRRARRVILWVLLLGTALQKVAVPGTGGAVPLSLPLLYLVIFAGLANGRLTMRGGAITGVATLAIFASLSYISSPSASKSPSSLTLLLALHIPYIVRLADDARFRAVDAARLFCDLMTIFAALGILQFVGQFAVSSRVAFFLDGPEMAPFRFAGYNVLNNFYYGSTTYKSNGVVFLEASTFNQCLCLAALIELVHFRRRRRLVAYAAGVVVTFSGTGLMMLALIMPIAAARAGQLRLVVIAASALALAYLLADQLGVRFFFDRVFEFTNPESSGFARFVSPFYYLGDHVFGDVRTMLLGRGSGTSMEFWGGYSFAPFAPSWAKTLYEQGFLGFLAYWGFLAAMMYRSRASKLVASAVLFEMALLGGYTLIPIVHLQVWALLAWPSRSGAASTSAGVSHFGAQAAQRT